MSNSFSRSSGAAVVCHDCALRLARPDADRGHWFCPRCGARLGSQHRLRAQAVLALAATALVLWAPAVTLPLVYVEQFGASGSVSVASSAAALLDDRYGLVAAVVLGTLVLMPAAQMTALLVAMARLHAGGRPRGWLWWYRQGREWAMPEIFLLGALIATTELGESASLRLGTGLFCLLGLVVARWVAEGLADPAVLDRILEQRDAEAGDAARV